jgi:hypothetical protein
VGGLPGNGDATSSQVIGIETYSTVNPEHFAEVLSGYASC